MHKGAGKGNVQGSVRNADPDVATNGTNAPLDLLSLQRWNVHVDLLYGKTGSEISILKQDSEKG